MYDIIFYKDKNGKSLIADYLRELVAKRDKDSRIKANKINDYIEYLAREGQNAKEPYVKHLDGEIWELRPIRDRILFAAWDDNKFVLLHHFVKKTQKTPQRELDKARSNLADLKERGDIDG
ncbi:MAG: type II toxin-antitoxin system RelE/ParE family toxin [Oscillospiraceae bacterium]|nr:type II toxin-antitoxin system RelE/ParE family toxin [Oscillospiraceae bacterium]